MHLLDQRFLGIAILGLLALLVAVKWKATGSILDKPGGTLMIQLVNIFNLFFLLVVNPLAAIALITRTIETIDPTHIVIDAPTILTILEIIGFALLVSGFLLMQWALITLGRHYQLGGTNPRPDDRMITSGPYLMVRHPMYSAALSISLGLACLVQSVAFFGVFCIYVALMILLVPIEEAGLRGAYGERYGEYMRTTKRIVPFVY